MMMVFKKIKEIGGSCREEKIFS